MCMIVCRCGLDYSWLIQVRGWCHMHNIIMVVLHSQVMYMQKISPRENFGKFHQCMHVTGENVFSELF